MLNGIKVYKGEKHIRTSDYLTCKGKGKVEREGQVLGGKYLAR